MRWQVSDDGWVHWGASGGLGRGVTSGGHSFETGFAASPCGKMRVYCWFNPKCTRLNTFSGDILSIVQRLFVLVGSPLSRSNEPPTRCAAPW